MEELYKELISAVRELFQKQGINYSVSEMNRSELYLELLPLIMSGKVQLLDNTKLITQLSSLERRTARSGKDSVDHPPGGHDDLANSAAGALILAVGSHNEIGEVTLIGEAVSTSDPFMYHNYT